MPKFRDLTRAVCVLTAGALVQCADEAPEDDELSGSASGFVRTAEIRQGRNLYLRSGCPLCHGKEGRGDGRMAGKYDPGPTNLHDREAIKRGRDLEALARVIEEGISVRGASTMPAHPHLANRDRQRIARYIRSLWAGKNGASGSG